jgi:hypothetical protein
MGYSDMEQEERIYMLMMDALDGEIAATELAELEKHLRNRPSLLREWQAMQAIDILFRQSPVLEPAADFAQRTLAKLPNHRMRLRVIGIIYTLLLLSGILPLLLGLWVMNRLGAVLNEPALLSGFWQVLYDASQVAGALVRAVVTGIGEFVVQQPAVLGLLLVMAGVVFVWSGVYRQLVNQSRQMSGRGINR